MLTRLQAHLMLAFRELQYEILEEAVLKEKVICALLECPQSRTQVFRLLVLLSVVH